MLEGTNNIHIASVVNVLVSTVISMRRNKASIKKYEGKLRSRLLRRGLVIAHINRLPKSSFARYIIYGALL